MQVIEGTSDEISQYIREHPQGRYKLIHLTDTDEGIETDQASKMLAVLDEIDKIQEGMPETSGEDTVRIIREGRAGGMYGDESASDQK